MRITALVIAALFVATASPAHAQDRAAGWAKWTDQAERVFNAIYANDHNRIVGACEGVFTTISRQGFAFPSWAMELVETCRVHSASSKPGGSEKRDAISLCKAMRRLGRVYAKATPVPEAPRAQQIALALGEFSGGVYREGCEVAK